MKSATLVKLAGALVVVSALTAIAWWVSRPARHPGLADGGLVARVTRVEFAGHDANYSFVKASGAWKMQSPVDYPAASNDLQNALEKLPKLSLSDELSSDPSRLDLFGLSASSATVVKLFGANGAQPELEFAIGKEGPDWDSLFLRQPGKGAVLAQGLPARDIKKTVGDWLDKTVTHYPADRIDRLVVVSKGGRVEFKKTGERWLYGSGRAVSTGTVEGMVRPAVSVVAGLEADHVLPAKTAPKLAQMGLAKPELTLEFAGPAAVTLKVGAKDRQNDRYLQRVGEDRVFFLVPDWKFDALRKREFASIPSHKGVVKSARSESVKESKK